MQAYNVICVTYNAVLNTMKKIKNCFRKLVEFCVCSLDSKKHSAHTNVNSTYVDTLMKVYRKVVKKFEKGGSEREASGS